MKFNLGAYPGGDGGGVNLGLVGGTKLNFEGRWHPTFSLVKDSRAVRGTI